MRIGGSGRIISAACERCASPRASISASTPARSRRGGPRRQGCRRSLPAGGGGGGLRGALWRERWRAQVGESADSGLVLLRGWAVSRFRFPVSRLPKVVSSIRAAKDPLTLKDLAISGDDLIAAGVRPGPEVGETLARLLGDVLDDPTRNTREQLLARV